MPTDGVYVILEGCVRVSGVNRFGAMSVLDFYGPGHWIGDTAVLTGSPRNFDHDAYPTAVLFHIDEKSFEDLLLRHPQFCLAYLRLQSWRLQIVVMAIEQYSTHSLEHRLANRLLMLLKTFGVQSGKELKIDLYLPQETLAVLIGSTRQRVNQLLKVWDEEEIVRHHHGIVYVLKPPRLEVLAEH